MKLFGRRELLVALGFACVSALAHLVWNPISVYWQFLATTAIFVAGLTWWLIREWKRLGFFVTKFYCVAVILDVIAEGALQPFHHCTQANLLCTGRMFLVILVFWAVLRPLELWFHRASNEPA
jgi:hypothetical protein